LLSSRPHILSPPPWAVRFRSDDLDAVRSFSGSTGIAHSRVAHRSQALGYDFYSVVSARTVAGGCKVAATQTLRGRVSNPVLHLTLPLGSVYRVGRQVFAPTGSASAVFVAPDWEFTRTSPPGAAFGIQIDQRALLEELESQRPSAAGRWALRLEPIVLAQAARAELMAAAADLLRATEPGTEARRLAHAESRVFALVADLVLRESVASASGSLSLARAAVDLEGWIDANLGEPITLGRLCQVAGVGVRGLQKTFESRRGMSPMRFVAKRRLTAAYHRLVHAAPDASVTRVALDLGFDHLGRFAQMYRQVIGESPSQTLAARGPSRTALQPSLG
jgi:AraC-like DNA-binding protein